jgi:DNA-binding NarL/FixJ family response regulator
MLNASLSRMATTADSSDPGSVALSANLIDGSTAITYQAGEDMSDRSMPCPHLVLVDSKALTRACLSAAIRSSPMVASIVAMSSVAELGELPLDTPVDGVILNLGSSAITPVTLSDQVEVIHQTLPHAAILVLASHPDPESMATALRAGVRGYLSADLALPMVLDVVRFVCAGWVFYPASMLQMPLPEPVRTNDVDPAQDDKEWSTNFSGAKLTPRQQEVLRCLAKGMANKMIAYELTMSESTVKAHLQGIMRRFGVVSRTQVVALLNRERTSIGIEVAHGKTSAA